MRKAVMGMTTLLLASLQGNAQTVMTARDYAVNSDVVLESAVREVKSAPRDTVNVVGDAVKMVSDETVTAAKGVASVFKADPIAKDERNAALETANAWNSANDIIFRSYKVSESVGKELAEGNVVDAQTGALDVSGFFNGVDFPKHTSALYRPEFKRLFVRQTLDNMLTIEDRLADEHSAKRNLMGKQVEIQTKFIEVSQNTLKQLGFDWEFVSKDGGAANIFENLTLPGQKIMDGGLRTTAAMGSTAAAGELLLAKTAGSLRWNLVISALEQSDDADVLSAPSVTTLSGKSANIWVGEDQMVPKSLSATSQNTSVFVGYSGWKSELIGVQMEVTPELRKGKEVGLIDLTLKPRVMDLIGYDSYQLTPADASMIVWARASGNANRVTGRYPVLSQMADGTANAVGAIYNPIVSNLFGAASINDNYTIMTNVPAGSNYKYYTPGSYGFGESSRKAVPSVDGIQVPQVNGNLPYFRLREMSTQVTVADGSTIGMGGLIFDKLETYKDKVPVLGSIPLIGRLFRSEGERSVKRNLMIFVTATEVDVNGRRASDLAMKK